ncbi:MAG: TonB-dependent receptor plug domain-containing protein [Opitutaceae bacterium]
MKSLTRPLRWISLGALLPVASLLAQTAPNSVAATELAKYDKNKNGRLDSEEIAVMRADEARAAVAGAEKRDVVELTPFEVKAGSDRGYAASNTLAGTRLNSRLEDLAGSISVVTKQQLEDTAALDINDIFLYEIGTEGTGQFTDLTNDGRGDYDNVAGNPTGANRMRGLSAATIAVGGFTASSSIPIDTYNIDAVEIARGPNSSLAGLSEGGGAVNLVTSRGNLSRSITTVVGRVDSYGGFRASLDLNRPLIKDKLAVRFSAVYNEIGYIRKPSVERNNRQQLSLTARPFSRTTISVSAERFSQYAQRANSITPRDAVSPWIAAGSPTYDPISRTYQVRGIRSAPITNINQLPVGLSTIGSSNVRIGQYIDGGAIQYQIRGVAPVNTNLNTSNTLTQVVQSSGINVAGPLYKVVGTTDKSFYDWEEINLAASGFATGSATIWNATIDQGIFNTPRNRTDAQFAWRREDQQSYQRQHIGQLDGVGTTVLIDATERQLDGSPNPFVGRPYIGGNQPQSFRKPVFNDNYRLQLAHQLDLRKETNLLQWVGLHRGIVYGEHVTNFEVANNGYRYRDFVTNVGPLNPTAAAGASRARNESSTFTRYYMGDAVGGNIDYANSGASKIAGSFPVRFLETTTAPGNGGDPTRWTTLDSTIDERYFALNAQKRKTNTGGFTLQSFLLKEHLITTYGQRQDRVFTSQQLPIPNLADGFPDPSLLDEQDHFGRDKKWREGKTETKGAVAKPFRSLPFLQQEGRTGLGGVLTEAVRGFALHYNQSNSFKPADVAYNVYLGELANPQAETKEYGFSLNLFDNRFFMRLTHQKTLQIDKRGGTGVIGTRAVSIDFDIPGQTRNFDLFQSATGWAQQRNPTLTLAQAQAQAAKDIGFSLEQIAAFDGKSINDSSNSLSRGWELEMQINPTRNWTMKVTANQQEAIDSGVSVHIQRYIEERLPIWTTIRNPQGQLWWDTADGGDVPSSYYFTNVRTPLDLAITTQGKKKPQTREYTFNFITNYRLAGIAGDRKWLRAMDVGGAWRWASKGAIGYLGGAADPDGVVRRLDASKPVYDTARSNIDLSMSYRTRFFKDRVGARFQLNVRNVTEGGSLRGVAVNPDGRYWQYRIIDPRQFILTTTFSL